jgi:putative hydrolase of the HAD superfamily
MIIKSRHNYSPFHFHHHHHHHHPSVAAVNNTTVRGLANWPKLRPKRVRVITCDVTGTLVSFRGSLEQHYLGAARKSGVDLTGGGSSGSGSPNNTSTAGKDDNADDVPIAKAFNVAYKEMSRRYPCFGGSEISAKEWWKLTVLRSFELAGVNNMTVQQQELVFQRVYSTFGSLAAYELFADALPFLNFAVKNHVICGVVR